MSNCDCNTFYFLSGQPKCLHWLFQNGHVEIVVKQKDKYGNPEFCIYRDKPKEKSAAWKKKWWLSGARSRLSDRKQILLAIELAEKYQVRKVRL